MCIRDSKESSQILSCLKTCLTLFPLFFSYVFPSCLKFGPEKACPQCPATCLDFELVNENCKPVPEPVFLQTVWTLNYIIFVPLGGLKGWINDSSSSSSGSLKQNARIFRSKRNFQSKSSAEPPLSTARVGTDHLYWKSGRVGLSENFDLVGRVGSGWVGDLVRRWSEFFGVNFAGNNNKNCP